MLTPGSSTRRRPIISSLGASLFSLLPGSFAFPACAGAAPSDAVGIAIFDFELEDFSAGASTSGDRPTDAANLALATADVRRLMAQSGRYRLVDVAGSNAQAVKEHALRNCNGCDAAIALGLGADQSMIGVVTRISMTEYTVRFQIRDARTGSVVSSQGTDVRMGANYSWNRGSTWLVNNRLLAAQATRPADP